jgi:transcriptional regulator with XRE-family HTH domain
MDHAVIGDVAQRMRARRISLGWSQQRLAEAADLTLAQIRRYEGGIERIGPGRLCRIAKVLDIPVFYFFDDRSPGRPARRGPGGPPDGRAHWDRDMTSARETLELVKSYFAIRDDALRQRLLELVRDIGRRSNQAEPDRPGVATHVGRS